MYFGDYGTYEAAKTAIGAMSNAQSSALNRLIPAFSDFHLQMEWCQVGRKQINMCYGNQNVWDFVGNLKTVYALSWSVGSIEKERL